MLVVLTSAKGSPGVSTAAMAMGAAWQANWRPVILECDSSGGDLAAGFGLSAEPGLLTLASAARRTGRAGLLWEHTQELPGGLEVVPAPTSAEQAGAAVDVLMSSPAVGGLDQLPQAPQEEVPLRGFAPRRERPAGGDVVEPAEESVVLADLGRLPAHLGAGEGVSRLLAAADVVLLVARNEQQGIVHAAARLEALRSAAAGSGGQVRMLLVGAATFTVAEVALTLQVPVAGTLPADERAAAVLLGRPARRAGNLARLPLVRAASVIGRQLSTEYVRARSAAEGTEDSWDAAETGQAGISGAEQARWAGGGPPLREQAW